MKMKREYVEIGGVKWAKMNIGAEKETDIGLYFQYGAEQGYPCPTNLYKFDKRLKNFCDSVQTYWGDKWRIPTRKEFDALISATTNECVTDYQGSGVNGMLFTDKTDTSKKLFFPACGYCSNGSVYGVGKYGYYWSSSHSNVFMYNAWFLAFYDGGANMFSNDRYFGYGVRGVLVDK